MERLVPDKTAVIVVDIQERLTAAMPERRVADVVRATTVLVESARLLGAPVFATVQYTKGLGPMIASVATVLGAASVVPVEKTQFSAADAPGFVDALKAARVTDVVVVGMETHVCVYQTARDLVGLGTPCTSPRTACVRGATTCETWASGSSHALARR
ncbi:MAG TPA: isochorismatase family protein [Polyangiaceae bacterium]|jgi:nicotinamidase-related amidase|nr:isochorismatase family protein [Polyangiaceae bacterium]